MTAILSVVDADRLASNKADRQRLASAILDRVNRVAQEKSLSAVLEPGAVQEARDLAALMDEVPMNVLADMSSWLRLGILHWYRSVALDGQEGQEDYRAAIRMFTLCFTADVFVEQIPEPLLPVVRDSFTASAWAALQRAFETSDRGKISFALKLWRRVVDSAAADHPERDLLLTYLGLALQMQFVVVRAPEDLDEAIAWMTKAIEATSPDNEELGARLNVLSNLLLLRFEHAQEPRDLDAAIACLDRGAASPAEGKNLALWLTRLGSASLIRYSLKHSPGDLNVATECMAYLGLAEAAVTPMAEKLLGLATERKDHALMVASTHLWRRLLDSASVDTEERVRRLSLLADALNTRFQVTGIAASLDQAIVARRQIIEAHATSPLLFYDRNYLDVALRARFDLFGDSADLDEVISIRRTQAVNIPDGYPRPYSLLINLAIVLENRFELAKAMPDLDEAIQVRRSALELIPDDSGKRTAAMNDLALALRSRLEISDSVADLDEMISIRRQLMALTTPDHDHYHTRLHSLAQELAGRFDLCGRLDDLDEAIGMRRELVAVSSPESEDYAVYLNNLAIALSGRFAHSQVKQDIDEAIVLGRQAISLTPAGDARRAGRLHRHGRALWARYGSTASPSDLDESITVLREAATADTASAVDRTFYLNSLGNSLRMRYYLAGALSDIDEAITADREAAALESDESIRAAVLNNLGAALTDRFARTGKAQDGNDAVTACRESATVLSGSGTCLDNLGRSLRARYDTFHSTQDLEDAIVAHRAAVEALGADDQDRGRILSNLAATLVSRFRSAGKREDLTEAISYARQSVSATPADHYLYGVALNNLARLIEHTSDDADYDVHEAAELYAKAAYLSSLAPAWRIRTAQAAARLTVSSDPSKARMLLEDAVQLLPHLVPRQLASVDQQHVIGEFSGIAANAAALVLSDPGIPESERPPRALALLEAGRTTLFNQALETHHELADLRAQQPELAAEYLALCKQFNHSSFTMHETPLSAEPSRVLEVAPSFSHRRTAGDLQAVLDRIRELRGLESFATSPTASELIAEAGSGPIVTFNLGESRSDAILLTSTGISTVPLPGLTEAAVVDQVNYFYRALSDATNNLGDQAANRSMLQVLAWLWDEAVRPILDALGYDGPPASDGGDQTWPRIWWVPGGMLSTLPLHAAGYHGKDFLDQPNNTLDRVISSYIPTIGALRNTRRRMRSTDRPQSERALVVAMPTTPGLEGHDLPNAMRETSVLLNRFPDSIPLIASGSESTSLAEGIPTRANVLALLPHCTVAHFACHGHSDIDPSRSRLILHDHRESHFSVATLASVNLDSAGLAYLSACSTAMNRKQELLDESIHLASAFHLAGFPHVIGTLWSINDNAAVRIARTFYDKLDSSDGRLDLTSTAYALHQATQVIRASRPDKPSLWAAHVHVGA